MRKAFLLVAFFLFLSSIVLLSCDSDEIDYQGSKADYTENYRPQIHFSPQKNWMNDPNGMVYLDGEYHLFYQYNPLATVWGNMSWGHAVSKDLLRWEQLPAKLYPDELGDIFSGCAVIDKNNTAGFGENGLVAIYTSSGQRQTQSIAYSTDRGRTFTKYSENPVLENPGMADFRDPKVFWHEATNKWVMSLATHHFITFYGSENLIDWDHLSEFRYYDGGPFGIWECPDLFPLEFNGEKKWVLLVSTTNAPNGGTATQYFVGSFDGISFKADPAPYPLWLDYGRDNYAGVTWSNIPEADGRALFIGWMSNWNYANQTPTIGFRGAMTLPRSLSLMQHSDNYLLLGSEVVSEIESIASDWNSVFQGAIVSESKTVDMGISAPPAYELELEFSNIQDANPVIELYNGHGDMVKIELDLINEQLYFDRRNSGNVSFNSEHFPGRFSSPVHSELDKIKLNVFVDQSSVEVFVNNGLSCQTNLVFPKEIYDQMNIVTDNGSLDVNIGVRVFDSIW